MGIVSSRVTHNHYLRHLADAPSPQFHIAKMLHFSANQYICQQG